MYGQKDWRSGREPIPLPKLVKPAVIDGSLDDWRMQAFHDGVWDIHRVQRAPWFEPGKNRLTDHGYEPVEPADDLSARYYMAWDDDHLYLGAEVRDNLNDVSDPAHEPKRWYYKDAICWFVEAPKDEKSEFFGQGDNAFCFVIDARRPSYGAWWRHGDARLRYIEEPLPKDAVTYAIRMKPTPTSKGDFVLEARLNMRATLGKSDPAWRPSKTGDEYGVEIVHTDPDGGGYGGHLIIWGTGDDDATWGTVKLSGPAQQIERKPR